jgi:hypothetical protein
MADFAHEADKTKEMAAEVEDSTDDENEVR